MRTALAWTVSFMPPFLIPSQMIQETDPYRYLWDGANVLRLENPYLLSPSESFARLESSGRESPGVREVFRKIKWLKSKTMVGDLYLPNNSGEDTLIFTFKKNQRRK